MPGVNTWFPSTPSASENVFGGAAEEFPDQPAAGDDFDRLMQATLAPQAHKPPERNPPLLGRNQPAARPSDTTNEAAAPTSTEKTHDKVAGENVDAKKKNTTDADGKNSADANSPAVTPAATEPPPILWSLPLFLFSPFSDPSGISLKAGKTGAAGKISTDGSQADGKPASTAGDAPTGAAAAAPSPILPPRPEKALPANDLTPAGPAAATAPDKNQQKLDTPADLAANQAVKSAAEPGVNVANKGLDPATGDSFEQAAANAGTGVAIVDSPMKNQQKTNKVAGPDAKVLPVGENGAVRGYNLPSQLPVTPVRAADNRGMDFNFSFSNGSSQTAAAENTPALNIVDLPSLMDARMRALDRTQDMMSLHAMRLIESKSDVLSVVIKPSVDTEMSLELHLHPEGIEARATLTRGDHDFLSQHWPELQERLEQRGIKLAPLGGETDFSAGGNNQFQRPQTSQEEAAQQASAFAEFASAGTNGGATARLALVHDGWESWA